MKSKYILNTLTNTLHIYNKCCHSMHISSTMKIYETKDQVIKENQNYIKECKLCFRGI